MLIFFTGCSSRSKTPVIGSDSTITYPAKNIEDISAKIIFCRDEDKKSGSRIGEGKVFTIQENKNVQAFVEFDHRSFYGNKEIMLHLDWIDPNGRSFYRKQVNLSPDDSSSVVNSSISISPDKRSPGAYKLQVYLFRELIAEKIFELRPEFMVNDSDEAPLAKITLYRKISKKTGKLIGEGTDFTIKNKENIRASVEIYNQSDFNDQDMLFALDWIGPDGKPFYSKEIDLAPNDSISNLNSSISISPDKREPGNYIFQISLFGKLIAEQNFEIHAESKKFHKK